MISVQITIKTNGRTPKDCKPATSNKIEVALKNLIANTEKLKRIAESNL